MGAGVSSMQGHNEDDHSTAGKDGVDPVLEKMRNLHVVTPLFKQQPTDASITEILLQRSPSQGSGSEALDPTSTAQLFTMYQEWQRMTAAKVGKHQEDLGFKIIGVEELSIKLFHRLNYASNVMESSATHLREVHLLHDEIADMKQKLTKTLGDYETLRQKVNALGLQKQNIKPMAIGNQVNTQSESDA